MKAVKVRLLACVGTMVIAGGVFVASAPSAGAGSEFSLVSHQTNLQFVTGGVSTTVPPAGRPVPGDRLMFRDDLLSNNAVVGFDNVVCTVTFNNNLLCDAMYAINGKGDIHLSALLRGGASDNGPAVFDAVIDGGTYAYRSAHGYVHLSNLPNGDTLNTFTLD